MALPVLERAWEFDFNHRVAYGGDTAAHYSAWLYTMKETWKGWTTGAMTVAGSSDASANWDWSGTDYWNTPDPPSRNNPWFVLNMNGGGQLMMTRTTTAYVTKAYYSPGGLFTGGGLNTPPTASDQIALWENKMIGGDLALADLVFQSWHSIDGDYEISIPFQNNTQMCVFVFSRLANTVDGWEDGRVWLMNGTNNNIGYSLLNVNKNWKFRHGGAVYSAYGTGLGWDYSVISSHSAFANNQFTNKAPLQRIGLFCDEPTARGWHGRFTDLFWANDASYATGHFYEEDVENPLFKWIQIGALILPWDGATTAIVKS